MAFRSFLRKKFPLMNKQSEIKIDIDDPTDPRLLDEHRRLMDQLFLAEEKKHHIKGVYKQKKWEKNHYYEVSPGVFIRFPRHEVSRRPKRYAIVIVGPTDSIPDFEQRKLAKEKEGVNLLYLKKNSEGLVDVCAASDTVPHTLTEGQSRQLKKYFNQPETCIIRRIPKTQKMISDIQVITGYHYYLYQVTNIFSEKPDARGNYGKVNVSPGKLKFIGEGESRKTAFVPGKPIITKRIDILTAMKGFISYILKYARGEMRILSTPALKARLGTKGGATVQKDKNGNVISITLVQGKMPGKELYQLYPHLTISQRFKAAKLFVQGVNNDHLAGIAHRDLKLENVMLYINPETDEMELNPIDYGFAQTVAESQKRGDICGTFPYISPEMVATGLGDQQSDDYGAGMLLRELFGDRVFSKMLPQNDSDQDCLKEVLVQRYKRGDSLEKPSCPMLDSLKKLGGVQKERAELYENIMYGMTLTDRSKRTTSASARSQIEAFERTHSHPEKVGKEEKEEKAISPSAKKPQIFDYLETAWDETYLRDCDPVDRKNAKMAEFLFGWPGKNGKGAWASYLLGGFVLTPFKNMLKLIEFSVKAISQIALFAMDYLETLHPSTQEKKMGLAMGWAACYFMHGLFALAGWIVSAVTSPMANARAGWKETGAEAIGLVSAMITVAVYAAIFVTAFPLVPCLIPFVALVARGVLSAVLETCWTKSLEPEDEGHEGRFFTNLEPRHSFRPVSTTTTVAQTLQISPARASQDKRPVTQRLPISRDFAADRHPSLLAQRRDTPVTASGSYTQSAQVSNQRLAC